ncbi:MAG: hypothetical protein ABFD86_16480, partial [Bryobacteraceae bacterium]
MQTPQEFTTASRRPLDVEDYLDMARRHKAWILGPAFLGLVVAVVVAMLWPDTYVARAVLRITPPMVSERLVPSNLSTEMSQRIYAMSQKVLSRTVLISVIEKNNLFANRRKSVPMEDLVEEMQQKRIKIDPIGPAEQSSGHMSSAFQIAFSYSDRYVAKKVAEDLVSRFTSENLEDRRSQAIQTTDFLTSQLDAARKDLEVIDGRLTTFRLKNAGRLPDQVNSNLQQLNALLTQQTTVNSNINRATQEKLLLETRLKTLQDQINSLKAPPEETVAAARNERLVAVEREIQNSETTLAALREHYRDIHPDIQKLQTHLSFLRKQRDNILRTEGDRAPATAARHKAPTSNREIKEYEAAAAQTKAMITTKDLELAELVKDQKRISTSIETYQKRIDSSPLGEKEYTEVMRDRELASSKFEELSRKQSSSKLATDQENRQLGEQLEVLDPPALPMTPTEPKRLVIIGMGLALGFLLGFCLAGVREVKDTTLKNLKDVRAYTKMIGLGSVP